MKFYGIELADGSEIKNLVAERVDNLPTGLDMGDKGRIVFHNANLAIWDGSNWITLVISTGTHVVTSFSSPHLPTPRKDDVVLSADDLIGLLNENNLPTASNSVRGAIKIGTGLHMNGDVLSTDAIVIPPPPAASIPSGAITVFCMAAAPTGWVNNWTNETNTYMIRIVNSGGGVSGGTDNPIYNDKVPSHTHSFSGSTSSAGSHYHDYYSAISLGAQSGSNSGLNNAGTGTTSNAGAHTHAVTGSIGANGGASAWSPRYLDFILCQKT